MTELYFNRGGGKYHIAAKGHATGSEAACAGVSAIMYTLAGYLLNAAHSGIVADVSGHLLPGDAEQSWSGSTEAETAFNMAYIGLRQIAESYSPFVKVVVDNSFVMGEND
jgi:uncharacterized protein YsxB (DUF464 family)